MGRYLNFNGYEICSKGRSALIIDTSCYLDNTHGRQKQKHLIGTNISIALDSPVYTVHSNQQYKILAILTKVTSDSNLLNNLLDYLYDKNFEWHEYNGDKQGYEQRWKDSIKEDVIDICEFFKKTILQLHGRFIGMHEIII